MIFKYYYQNNIKFNNIMYKNKSIKIILSIDTTFIEILPTISIYPIERNIAFHWIIFEIDICY